MKVIFWIIVESILKYKLYLSLCLIRHF